MFWEDSGSEDLTAYTSTESAYVYYRQDKALLACATIVNVLKIPEAFSNRKSYAGTILTIELSPNLFKSFRRLQKDSPKALYRNSPNNPS